MMTTESVRLSSDQPQPYVSKFLMLPLRTRAEVQAEIDRARRRIHWRETQPTTPSQ